MTKYNNYLFDAAILRPLAIVLLVLYHSFAPYCGGWNQIEGMPQIEAYWWIGRTTYFCMLELFVFISGYVFALSNEKKNYTLKALMLSKGKRLIIPGLFFSILYFIMFRDLSSFSLKSILDFFSGVGHLWFLPMLFWVFVFNYILMKAKIGSTKKYIICGLLIMLSILPIPFGIAPALYYLCFFYSGYSTYKVKDKTIHKKPVLFLVVATVIVFITTTITRENFLNPLLSNSNILVHLLSVVTQVVFRAFTAILGVYALYYTTEYFIHRGYRPSQSIILLNKYCFGIYIFQQFILQILYYHSPMADLVGYIWLPWLSFIITFSLSFIFTYLSKLTTIGNKLF